MRLLLAVGRLATVRRLSLVTSGIRGPLATGTSRTPIRAGWRTRWRCILRGVPSRRRGTITRLLRVWTTIHTGWRRPGTV